MEAEDLPPRYIWRRFLATIVDLLIAGLISTILLWPFLGDRSGIRLDASNLSFTNCLAITKMGPDLAALFPDYRLTGGTVCDHYTYFVYNGQSLNLSAEQDGSDTKTTISFPVTFSGNDFVSVAPIEPQSPVSLAIFILGSATFLTFATATPGKRLLGLYVDPDAPFPRLLKREALRNLPLIVEAIAQFPDFFSLQSASPAMANAIGITQIAALITAAGLALLLWIIPLIRWRGTMPYDRATGLQVTRA
jgi:RDD family